MTIEQLQELADKQEEQIQRMDVPEYDSKEFQRFLYETLGKSNNPLSDVARVPKTSHGLEKALQNLSEKAQDGCKKIEGLLPHQAVVYAVAKLRELDKTKSPGLLAVHSTGAGKTVEGLAAMMAFWNKTTTNGQPYAIISVSTKGNQDSNSPRSLAKYARTFFAAGRHMFVSRVPGIATLPFNPHVVRAAEETEEDVEERVLDQIETNIRKRIEVGLKTIAASDNAYEILKSKSRAGLYTYRKLSNDLNNGMFRYTTQSNKTYEIGNALIIVDEIQFLFVPPETGYDKAYESLQTSLTSKRSLKSTWVLGLTATPGSTLTEVCDILNLIKGRSGFVSPASNISEKARGLVSYAQVQGDLHHFPRLEVYPLCIPVNHYSDYYLTQAVKYERFHDEIRKHNEDMLAEIDERKREHVRKVAQYETALKAWRKGKGKKPEQPKARTVSEEDPATWKFDPKKKSRFYAKLRQSGNWVSIRGDTEELKVTELECLQAHLTVLYAVDGTCEEDRKILFVLSPKITMLMKNLNRLPGKHYVYSSDKTTILLIAALLERDLHMAQLRTECYSDETEKLKCKANLPADERKYFMLLDNVTSTRRLLSPEKELSKWQYPNQPQKRIQAVKRTFDLPENLKGGRVKIVLATKENYKGVDLKAIRNIHCLEPMLEFTDLLQLAGRGPRFCSHAGLKPVSTTWKVQLYTYRLALSDTFGKEIQADMHVFEQSVMRYVRDYGKETNAALQKASVDYLIFKDNINLGARHQVEMLMKTECWKPQTKAPKAPRVIRPATSREAMIAKRKHQKEVLRRRQESIINLTNDDNIINLT